MALLHKQHAAGRSTQYKYIENMTTWLLGFKAPMYPGGSFNF